MIRKPIYRPTPEQAETIKRAQGRVAAFFLKHPTPYEAWMVRQPSKDIRWLWDTLQEPGLTPEKVLCLFEGRSFKVPSYRKLRGFWFRAAWRELHDLLPDSELAAIFKLPRSTYEGLINKEREWKPKRSATETPRHRKARQAFWTQERQQLIHRLNLYLNHTIL